MPVIRKDELRELLRVISKLSEFSYAGDLEAVAHFAPHIRWSDPTVSVLASQLAICKGALAELGNDTTGSAYESFKLLVDRGGDAQPIDAALGAGVETRKRAIDAVLAYARKQIEIEIAYQDQ